MKKTLALILSLTLLLACGVPALAADGSVEIPEGMREEYLWQDHFTLCVDSVWTGSGTQISHPEDAVFTMMDETAKPVEQLSKRVLAVSLAAADFHLPDRDICRFNISYFTLRQPDGNTLSLYGYSQWGMSYYDLAKSWDGITLYYLLGDNADIADLRLSIEEPESQPWPETGVIWQDKSYALETRLIFDVNLVNSEAMHIKVYRNGDVPMAQLFFGASGRASIWLPAGEYTIKDGLGREWYGKDCSFGTDGYYEVMTFDDYGTSFVRLQNGYVYTLSLNTTTGSGDDVGQERTDYNTF